MYFLIKFEDENKIKLFWPQFILWTFIIMVIGEVTPVCLWLSDHWWPDPGQTEKKTSWKLVCSGCIKSDLNRLSWHIRGSVVTCLVQCPEGMIGDHGWSRRDGPSRPSRIIGWSSLIQRVDYVSSFNFGTPKRSLGSSLRILAIGIWDPPNGRKDKTLFATWIWPHFCHYIVCMTRL